MLSEQQPTSLWKDQRISYPVIATPGPLLAPERCGRRVLREDDDHRLLDEVIALREVDPLEEGLLALGEGQEGEQGEEELASGHIPLFKNFLR